MKSKISDNKCHNINTNNQNDKIPGSAPSELRYTTTNINKNNKKNNINKINNNNNYNQKISAKRILTKKINNDNINNSMANNINPNSWNESNNKNNITLLLMVPNSILH